MYSWPIAMSATNKININTDLVTLNFLSLLLIFVTMTGARDWCSNYDVISGLVGVSATSVYILVHVGVMF